MANRKVAIAETLATTEGFSIHKPWTPGDTVVDPDGNPLSRGGRISTITASAVWGPGSTGNVGVLDINPIPAGVKWLNYWVHYAGNSGEAFSFVGTGWIQVDVDPFLIWGASSASTGGTIPAINWTGAVVGAGLYIAFQNGIAAQTGFYLTPTPATPRIQFNATINTVINEGLAVVVDLY